MTTRQRTHVSMFTKRLLRVDEQSFVANWSYEP
jgi:hypothetical protein